MAEGRLLNKRISRDERVAQLSPHSQLLYAYSIPTLDNEGRMPGEPGAVRLLAAKSLPWDDPYVDALIAEWTRTTRVKSGQLEVDPLVIRYPLDPSCRWRDKELQAEFECRLALAFQGFAGNQPLRLRRGARSTLPPPDTAAAGQMVLLGHGAHDAQGDHVGAMDPMGDDLRLKGSRERGSGVGLKDLASGLEVQDLAAAAASRAKREQSTPSTGELGWFAGEFAARFGHAPSPTDPERGVRLEAAIATIGREEVSRLLRDRASTGTAPKSLVYFLPALEELQAVSSRAGEPTRTPIAPCEECGVGGGRHADACLLVTPSDRERVAASIREMAELGGDKIGRQMPAA